MRVLSQFGYVLGGSAALGMLAACSGGSSPNTPISQGGNNALQAIGHQTQSRIKNVLPPYMQDRIHIGASAKPINPVDSLPAVPLGFISDFGNSQIYVVNTDGSVFATLTSSTGLSSPQGLSLTNGAHATLYVANSGANNILEYTSLGSPTTLSNGGVEPSDVAVDQAGNVAAMNITAATVNCFTGGATSPSFTIGGTSGTGTFSGIFFGAFDASGNLFIDGFNANGVTQIGEIVGGCSSSGNVVTDLTTSNTILYPGGLQVAKNGNVAIVDQEAATIYTYAAPSGGSLGSPVATTVLNGAADPVTFALTPRLNHLVETDAANLNASLYNYTAGGSPLKTAALPGASVPIGTATHSSEQF